MSTFKKGKVVMLPTNQKANGMICKDITRQDKTIAIKTKYLMEHEDYIGHHLYIISDDEIKEGDWVYENNLNQETQIYQIYNRNNELGFFRFRNVWISLNRKQNSAKKIIATTDNSLWRPSHKYASDIILLPQPSQQFIQKFVEEYNKGNVITDVLVEELRSSDGYYDEQDIWHWKTLGLKINPKDNTITIKEVKDNYTREEVDRMLDEQASRTTAEMLEKFKDYKSREEVIELITDAMSSCTNGTSSHCQDFDKWIEENL